MIEIADGYYALEKLLARSSGFPHRVTVRKVEVRFRLRRGQLANYRANHYSRK